jgi:hypothetical protein
MKNRASSSNDDRSNAGDTGARDRAREHRSGEGSESALANLKKIENERRRSQPVDERGEAQG